MIDRATGALLLEFLAVMRRLRAECAWKGSQTHRSLVRYLLEETHETVEAIESGDADHLREELGDLLLQVWFHAVIAEEAGDFTLDDVVDRHLDKLHRRNPHVFGDARAGDAAAVNEVWESIKAQEKQRTLARPTGCRRRCRRCSTPTRCSTGWPRPGRPVAPDPPGGDLGDRLLALVAEARGRGRRPRAGAARRRTPLGWPVGPAEPPSADVADSIWAPSRRVRIRVG